LTRPAVEHGVIITRRQCGTQIASYYDLPGDFETWDENALIIAAQYNLPLDKAHQMLARTFPHVYEERKP
jgi:hypothetical protein